MTKLAVYLGIHVNALLRIPPFSAWKRVSSTDEELPEQEVRYMFEGHGVEVICGEDQRVRTIFLRRGDGEALSDLAFSLGRQEVRERYGPPSHSSGALRLSVLGDYGPWDRFDRPTVSIHVQYRRDRDEIDMITLMRPDAVPLGGS